LEYVIADIRPLLFQNRQWYALLGFCNGYFLSSGSSLPYLSLTGYAILLTMRLTLAHIGTRPGARDSYNALTETYLERCSAFADCQLEAFRSQEAMLEAIGKRQGRTPSLVVLLDSRGKQMSSETFASWLGCRRDEGAQQIIFAIGPASGWSDSTRQRAHLQLSLGPMTLAHALARLVLAEQIYRAFTILTGHPYHGGH
jgi:23S rRNA (pseudouridine1915-N3)-methyltransferase